MYFKIFSSFYQCYLFTYIYLSFTFVALLPFVSSVLERVRTLQLRASTYVWALSPCRTPRNTCPCLIHMLLPVDRASPYAPSPCTLSVGGTVAVEERRKWEARPQGSSLHPSPGGTRPPSWACRLRRLTTVQCPPAAGRDVTVSGDGTWYQTAVLNIAALCNALLNPVHPTVTWRLGINYTLLL